MTRQVGTLVGIWLIMTTLMACAPIRQSAARAPLTPTADDRESFAHVDTDNNGALTWEEWRMFDTSRDARRNFETLDTDHDEAISRAEWTHNLGRSGVALRLFGRLDADDQASSERQIDTGPVAPVLRMTF